MLPVKRDSDFAEPGPGLITVQGKHVNGKGTLFKLLKPTDKITINRQSFKVDKIISDTELYFVDNIKEDVTTPSKYKVLFIKIDCSTYK